MNRASGWARKSFALLPEVAGEADAFWVNDRGPILQDMTDFIHHTATSGQTLTVLPEGAILNFLSRPRQSFPLRLFHATGTAHVR